MKFIFICLLIANAVLFAIWGGYLASPIAQTHQPERLLQQENSQHLKLISAQEATTVLPVNVPFSCLEWGAFPANELAKVEAVLKPLGFGNRQLHKPVEGATSTMVYIPPLVSKAAAEKKAKELENLGVIDFFIIQDSSSNLRWGISLGVFKSEAAAKQLLTKLTNQGVRSAVLGTRTEVSNKYNLVFNAVNSAEKASLDNLKKDFPAQDLHACKP